MKKRPKKSVKKTTKKIEKNKIFKDYASEQTSLVKRTLKKIVNVLNKKANKELK